jgi:hypothetical protein
MTPAALTNLTDLYDAARLLSRMVARLAFLPPTHISAMETYINTLAPPSTNPPQVFHSSVLALQSTIQAMLLALSTPPQLIGQITAARKAIERNYNSLSRSTRWPLGLLDETRQRINEEREEKARRTQVEVDELSKELRYTQQTVASELAGWQDMHERMGRKAIKEFARSMLIIERERMQGIKRALRKLQDVGREPPPIAQVSQASDGAQQSVPRVGGPPPADQEGESSAMGEAATPNGV